MLACRRSHFIGFVCCVLELTGIENLFHWTMFTRYGLVKSLKATIYMPPCVMWAKGRAAELASPARERRAPQIQNLNSM